MPPEFLYSPLACWWWWSIEVEDEDETTLAGRVKHLLNLSTFLVPSDWPSKLKNSFGFATLAFCTAEVGFALSWLNKSLASSDLPVSTLKIDNPFGHFMSFSCSLIMSPILTCSDDAWGMRNIWVSSLACGNPILAACWKVGEGSNEVADPIGLWPQLRDGGGGLIGMVDGFEGREVEEEVLLVEEKSCER